jgi:hypothetical protein
MNCCATVLLRYYGNATGYIGHVTKENPICHNIKILSNDTKQFKSALKNYLHAHSFYPIDAYFNVNIE